MNEGVYNPPSVASGPRSYSQPGNFQIYLILYFHAYSATGGVHKQYTLVKIILPISLAGYDGIPVEAMQNLDLNNDGNYGELQGYHNGGSEINYDNDLPSPPQDNNQVAAWYDTDL